MDMLLDQFSSHHISLSNAIPLSFGKKKKPKAVTNKLDKNIWIQLCVSIKLQLYFPALWMSLTTPSNVGNSLLNGFYAPRLRRTSCFSVLCPHLNGKTRCDHSPCMPPYKARHSYTRPPTSTPTPLTAYRKQQPTGWRETWSWCLMKRKNMNSAEWIVLWAC